MDPTSLMYLKDTGCVISDANGLTVTINPSWIIAGEDRLSYTTLIRIIECCREHHWNLDILAYAGDTPVDSILKTINANFINAILANSQIKITYKVTDVRSRGYSMRFNVFDAESQTLCAEIDIVSVFYDPVEHKSVAPPDTVRNSLSNLHKQMGVDSAPSDI